jgi:hypothetical protein
VRIDIAAGWPTLAAAQPLPNSSANQVLEKRGAREWYHITADLLDACR